MTGLVWKALRVSLSGIPQIQAKQLILAARKKQSIGEGGMGPNLMGKHLGLRRGFVAVRRCWSADQFAALGKDQEFIARQRNRGCAKAVLFPAHFAGFELNTAQAGGRLETRIGASMNAVEKATMIDAGRIMRSEERR